VFELGSFKFFLFGFIFMERNTFVALTLFFLIFVFAGIYFFFPQEEFKYKTEINGMLFYSNSFPSPQKYFSETVKQRENFMVISEVDFEEKNLPYVSSQIALASGILSATGKSVSSVIVVLDKNGKTSYCQTNFGSTSKNEKLTPRQCTNLIENSSEFKFIIKLYNESLNKPSVELYNNSVVITPTKKEEAVNILQQLFTAMYPNSKQIINRINEILHSVTG
jgi:hypothetical protein